jgi:putative redox protein
MNNPITAGRHSSAAYRLFAMTEARPPTNGLDLPDDGDEQMDSKVVLKDGMAFESHLEGFQFMVDADPEFGGQGYGPKPKGLVLTALAGCTAMDVISILRKMRVEVDGFEVEADGELSEEHPRKFTEITVTYRFEGTDLPADRLRRAVDLSENKYCAVNAMLRPTVHLRHQIVVNGEVLDEPVSAA